jgi:pyruvate/2-oxoglutarate dehydrogenase complex dihydrolipoamide dehydrogenase (E3) component
MAQLDLVVVGAGAAGLAAAQVAAAMRRTVALVESDRFGGECTWNGCVPSKALIEAARLRFDMERAPRFGVHPGEVRVDFPAVMRHVHDVIDQIARYEDAAHLSRTGITTVVGRARLADPGTVEVDGTRLETGRVVIATGSHPAIPPIDGLEAVPHLTNETLFELQSLPPRLLVIGAGPIGLEMAQAFQRLGSRVTVLDVLETLLPREDPDIAAAAQAMLEDEGIRFMLGARIQRASAAGDTRRLHLGDGDEGSTVEGDAILVATGRRPTVDGLGLDAVGVRVERGGVAVDQRLHTSVDGILAAGDVTGILPFTHAAAYQGRLAARNALGGRHRADYRVVPWIIFTDPEIAHVGLTEPEARQRHGDVHVVRLPFTAVDRAVVRREPRGMIKVITAGKSVIGHRGGGGEIIGAHLIGPGAGELLHEFVVSMQARTFSGRLAQAIHAYPSMSMGVQQAVAQLFPAGRALAGEMRTELAAERGAEAP